MDPRDRQRSVAVDRLDLSTHGLHRPDHPGRDTGIVSGVVEQLRTGEKARLRGLEALAGVIARMIERGPDEARPEEEFGAKPFR